MKNEMQYLTLKELKNNNQEKLTSHQRELMDEQDAITDILLKDNEYQELAKQSGLTDRFYYLQGFIIEHFEISPSELPEFMEHIKQLQKDVLNLPADGLHYEENNEFDETYTALMEVAKTRIKKLRRESIMLIALLNSTLFDLFHDTSVGDVNPLENKSSKRDYSLVDTLHHLGSSAEYSLQMMQQRIERYFDKH